MTYKTSCVLLRLYLEGSGGEKCLFFASILATGALVKTQLVFFSVAKVWYNKFRKRKRQEIVE